MDPLEEFPCATGLSARLLLGVAILPAAALLAVLPVQSAAASGSPNAGFGFNAPSISGLPTGSLALTGGGAFDPDTSSGFADAGGSFTCTAPVDQNQPPFGGCQQGEGVRWDTEESFTANMIVSTQDLDGDPTGGLCRTSGCRASVAAPPSRSSVDVTSVRAMRLSARSDAMDTSSTARFNSTDHAQVCPATSGGRAWS